MRVGTPGSEPGLILLLSWHIIYLSPPTLAIGSGRLPRPEAIYETPAGSRPSGSLAFQSETNSISWACTTKWSLRRSHRVLLVPIAAAPRIVRRRWSSTLRRFDTVGVIEFGGNYGGVAWGWHAGRRGLAPCFRLRVRRVPRLLPQRLASVPLLSEAAWGLPLARCRRSGRLWR
jgi:hypothetical protein